MSIQRDAARRFLVQAGLPLCHLASLTALVIEAERRGEYRGQEQGVDFALELIREHAPETAALIAQKMGGAERIAGEAR